MALVLLVLGLVGIAAVGVAWWPFREVLDSSAGKPRAAEATVVRSVPCGTPGSRDTVEVPVRGHRVRVPFDGCGHREGTTIRVVVPPDAGSEFVARPAPAEATERDLRARLDRVLLVLAAVAGAGYALLLGRFDRAERS